MNSSFYSKYKILIVSGLTDGATDFFNGVNIKSFQGHALLIKSMRFIPRFSGASVKNKEIQYLDETLAGNNYDLISPNGAGNPRIITSNVEFSGVDFKFHINNTRLQIVEGVTFLLPFDSSFDNMNLYYDGKVSTMKLTAQADIFTDVTNNIIDTFTLQVIFECIIDPSDNYLKLVLG